MRKILIGLCVMMFVILVVLVRDAMAKSPCSRGWELWHHITGNGKCKEQCFQKGKPPKNPEWKRGACRVDDPTEPSETEEPGPNETEQPGPIETDEPGPNENGGGGSGLAAITRMSTHKYEISSDGAITVWGIGTPWGSVRACKKGGGCFELSPPTEWTAVTRTESRGTLFLGMQLEPGVYTLYAHGIMPVNTGNDGGGKTRLTITK